MRYISQKLLLLLRNPLGSLGVSSEVADVAVELVCDTLSELANGGEINEAVIFTEVTVGGPSC